MVNKTSRTIHVPGVASKFMLRPRWLYLIANAYQDSDDSIVMRYMYDHDESIVKTYLWHEYAHTRPFLSAIGRSFPGYITDSSHLHSVIDRVLEDIISHNPYVPRSISYDVLRVSDHEIRPLVILFFRRLDQLRRDYQCEVLLVDKVYRDCRMRVELL